MRLCWRGRVEHLRLPGKSSRLIFQNNQHHKSVNVEQLYKVISWRFYCHKHLIFFFVTAWETTPAPVTQMKLFVLCLDAKLENWERANVSGCICRTETQLTFSKLSKSNTVEGKVLCKRQETWSGSYSVIKLIISSSVFSLMNREFCQVFFS